MAMLTKATLITQMQTELGDGQNQSADDTVYGYWVDEAIQVIWNKWKWQEKYASQAVSVSSGDAVFAVDNIFSAVHTITKSDGEVLNHIERDDLLNQNVDLTLTSSEPEFWCWDDHDTTNQQRQIRLWKVPSVDTTLTLYGYLRPDAELPAASTIPLPEEFLPALKEYVRFRSHDAEELVVQASTAMKQFGARQREAERLIAVHRPAKRNRRTMDNDLKQFQGYTSMPYLTRPSEIPY